MTLPLNGVTVIEVDADVAVATAGMHFRDAGARVIKLERDGGDQARHAPGHYGWDRGKESVVLAASAPARAALLATADVVIAPARASLPAGYIRPAAQILALSPAYSDASVFNALPRDDALASALTGVLAGTGAYRSGPAFPVLPTLSYAAGAALAGATMAALFVRQATGRGQEVEVAWPVIGTYLSGYQASVSDRIPLLPGAGGVSPQGLSIGWRVYRATDGWIGVACPNPTFFNRLIAAIDCTDLLNDPRFEHAPFVAPQDRDALASIIADAFATRSKAEWTERFEQFGVPGAQVLTRDEFAETSLVRDNNAAQWAEDPEVGRVRQVGPAFRLRGHDLAGPAAAPRLDEHAALPGGEVQAPAASAPAPAHPLAGIRVLDFTGYLAGPTAGRLLVELGAEVIKVEPPEGEGFRGAGLSCVGINVGKRSLGLDSRSQGGQEVLRRLITSADVLLHALIPGAPEKLGLDYESVRAINPHIVHCWISGFGDAAEYRGRPSFDLLLQALSGQMTTLGTSDSPVYSSIPMADLYAGMMAVYAIVLGLHERRRTGQGMAVTTNQVISSMSAQAGQFVSYPGAPASDVSADDIGRSAAERYYPLADGWAIVAAREATSWSRLVSALGQPLAAWHDWDVARVQPVDGPLAEQLGAALVGLTRVDVTNKLMAAGAPCAPVVLVREDGIRNRWFEDLAVLYRGISHERFGDITTVAGFFRFSETPAALPDIAQWVGEQNAEVLASAGYTPEEVEQLREARVVVSPELRMATI
ncbi:MAG: CoA transferase [Dehalococcoidia bacterium]|nr:CoA transferase [Dehalococcoidia bacterium]